MVSSTTTSMMQSRSEGARSEETRTWTRTARATTAGAGDGSRRNRIRVSNRHVSVLEILKDVPRQTRHAQNEAGQRHWLEVLIRWATPLPGPQLTLDVHHRPRIGPPRVSAAFQAPSSMKGLFVSDFSSNVVVSWPHDPCSPAASSRSRPGQPAAEGFRSPLASTPRGPASPASR